MGKVVLDKHPRRMGAMFDRIAPTYDFLNHFLSAGMDVQWRRQAVASLNPKPGDRLLDAATGTGDLAFSALSRREGLRVVGVDLAWRMLQEARRKREDQGVSRASYALAAADALRLPLRDASFDKAMIAYGIRNVPDMEGVLKELRRVLRKGGDLLILEFSLPSLPPLRSMYLFYFQKILPWLGGWISGDSEAYRYLPASVGAFHTPAEMKKRVEGCGFETLETRLLWGGVTYFLRARKRSRHLRFPR